MLKYSNHLYVFSLGLMVAGIFPATVNATDLNGNGRLDIYEDATVSVSERVRDLLSQMTLDEKIGQMLHGNSVENASYGQSATGYDLGTMAHFIKGQQIGAYVSRLSLPAREMAEANNSLQQLARDTRLGIPLLISTDPRHHFQYTAGASVSGGGFSKWPELSAFTALPDTTYIKEFAEIARIEYRLTGFNMALSPQLDLITEPRWPRNNGSFGADAEKVAEVGSHYVAGFQGSSEGITKEGIATVLKHWVGYGAAKDGFDAHNYYGRYADLKSDAFPLHLKPFEAAFEVKPTAVMPAYSIFDGLMVDGKTVEPVGAGYSDVLLQHLLRGTYGFEGIVLSDWAITNDCGDTCINGFPEGVRPSFEGISTAWGVEHLTVAERFAKAVKAGIDQFGGVNDAAALKAAVTRGLITEAQVDVAAARVLIVKFELGLFENPFVDPDVAAEIVGNPAFVAAGERVQAEAMVLLENKENFLPSGTANSKKVYLRNLSVADFKGAGYQVVSDYTEADFAVVRMAAPYEQLHPNFMFGSIQHEGSLDFKDDDSALMALKFLSENLPVVVTVSLDRPAILTKVEPHARVLFADFGVTDKVLAQVLMGERTAKGKLPFELPSSMAAVEAARSDVPSDTENPLYPIGYGLKMGALF